MGKYPGTVIMREKYPLNTTTSKVKDPLSLWAYMDTDISFIRMDLFKEF